MRHARVLPFSVFLFALVLLGLLVLAPPPVTAGVHQGALKGRVTEAESGEPLANVGVTVRSPALLGERTVYTDEAGQYVVTHLPPGDYFVRFVFADLTVEHADLRMAADQVLALNVVLDVTVRDREDYSITVRAPTVDVGSAQIQTRVGTDLVRKTPVRGRTYEEVLTFAPGAATDDTGITFSGASGPENIFLIDGMNTTNPAYGILGTPLSLEFLQATQVITAGYNAEYGRATGGVVNLVTKSGSNTFHGGAWVFYQPFRLEPKTIARLGEAIAARPRPSAQAFDFGLDLGGPVIEDRLWFYVGFAPSFIFDRYDRRVRSRLARSASEAGEPGAYRGDLDTNVRCPDWLSDQSGDLCPQGAFATEETGVRRTLDSEARSFNYITKLDLRLTDEHRMTLQYLGNPSRFRGVYDNPGRPNSAGNLAGAEFNADPAQMAFAERVGTHDVGLGLNSRFLGGDLLVDVLASYHREDIEVRPRERSTPQITDGREGPLDRYERTPGCEPRVLANGQTFDPCPVQNYTYGGFGLRYDQALERFGAAAEATYFLGLFGKHGLKLGADLQASHFVNDRSFTGGGLLTVFDPGDPTAPPEVGRLSYGRLGPDGVAEAAPNGFVGDVTSQTEAIYLRDAYSPSFLPGATINLGVRWEFQQMQNAKRETVLTVNDAIAPRIGFTYDWSDQGVSRVYASYGRFYESIPLGLLDRQQSGEYLVSAATTSCRADARGKIDPSSCTYPPPVAEELIGGFGKIAPKVKGQYSNEVVVGGDLDVFDGLILGAAVIHRNLGRVIEDISPDGARTFFIGNPGEAPDAGAVRRLEEEIGALDRSIAASSEEASATLAAQRDEKMALLAAYKGAATFPKPRRSHTALLLTAEKRFSRNFLVLASYTFSRTFGNYEGLYLASARQLDPNVSIGFDLPDLLVNQSGPLPSDRPHNLKLRGAYFFPIGGGEKTGFTVGGAFNALSGAPINVLGGFPFYGRRTTAILPRGSGGRTPTLTSLDLHLGYTHELAGYQLEVVADVFNVLNQRGVTAVDEEYTIDPVLGIPRGTPADLKNLTTTAGTRPTVNPNFGQPIARQAPLAARFGLRVTF